MPGNCEFDEKEAESFIENCGVSPATKYQQDRARKHFIDYLKSKILPAGDKGLENGNFWHDIKKLESSLIQYFGTFRKANNDLPKKNYLDATKSHICTLIKRE